MLCFHNIWSSNRSNFDEIRENTFFEIEIWRLQTFRGIFSLCSRESRLFFKLKNGDLDENSNGWAFRYPPSSSATSEPDTFDWWLTVMKTRITKSKFGGETKRWLCSNTFSAQLLTRGKLRDAFCLQKFRRHAFHCNLSARSYSFPSVQSLGFPKEFQPRWKSFPRVKTCS